MGNVLGGAASFSRVGSRRGQRVRCVRGRIRVPLSTRISRYSWPSLVSIPSSVSGSRPKSVSRPPRSCAAGNRSPPAGTRSLPRPRAQARRWRPFSPPSTRCSKRVTRRRCRTRSASSTCRPLKALSADIHKNLAEPRAGIHRLAEEAGLRPPRITAAVRTGDTTQAGAGGDAADAAAHSGDDAGIAVSAPHVRPQPADAAHRAHGDRRRDPRGHRLAPWSAPRVDARAALQAVADAVRHCSGSGSRRPRRRSRRSPASSPPAMPPAAPSSTSATGAEWTWASSCRAPRSTP